MYIVSEDVEIILDNKKYLLESGDEIVMDVNPEKEVERLLLDLLPGSLFDGKVYAVGGYVRDEFMGLDAKDLDIVVEINGGAEKVTKWLKDKFLDSISTPRKMGAGYPIWQITFKDDVEFDGDSFRTQGAVIEFADTMKEQFPDDTSRQREVSYGSLQDDVERRDFTANMLLKDLSSGRIIDLTGTSKDDIEQGILRGHPNVDLNKIFSDDPLRMIRLVRFQCKYGWSIPRSVLKIVRKNAHRIKIVSSERIMGELEKVMELGKLGRAVKLMKSSGLLEYVFPEVHAMIGVEQPEQYHKEGDVYRHTLKVLENAPHTIEGQLAALLHDVGKPGTQTIGDKIQFLGHDEAGAEIAEAMLRRLKFDSSTIKRVIIIVRNHMRVYNLVGASDKAIRKFIRDLGDLVDSVLDQADADELGSIPVQRDVSKIRDEIDRVRKSPIKIQNKPVLDGYEIMSILGIGPKDISRLPEIGKAGKFLLDLADQYAAEGRELTKQEAREKLSEMYLNLDND